jgi:hypothetical protein
VGDMKDKRTKFDEDEDLEIIQVMTLNNEEAEEKECN